MIFITLEIIEKHTLKNIAIGIQINHTINVIILSKVFLKRFFIFFNINIKINFLIFCRDFVFNNKKKENKYVQNEFIF